jgi:hypothetical protein
VGGGSKFGRLERKPDTAVPTPLAGSVTIYAKTTVDFSPDSSMSDSYLVIEVA